MTPPVSSASRQPPAGRSLARPRGPLD